MCSFLSCKIIAVTSYIIIHFAAIPDQPCIYLIVSYLQLFKLCYLVFYQLYLFIFDYLIRNRATKLHAQYLI